MAVTIKSIAEEAQVSFQAVSATLNNKGNCRVSAATRERILEIARTRGYRPNFGYKLMHHQATHTVAIVTSERHLQCEEYARDLVVHLIEKLNELGYASYFTNLMSGDIERNLDQVRSLMARGTEHFIFIGSPAGYEVVEQEIMRAKRTCVGFKAAFSRGLMIDSVATSRKMLTYLIGEVGDKLKLVIPVDPVDGMGLSARFAALCQCYPDRDPKELNAECVVPIPTLAEDVTDFSGAMFRLGYEGTKKAMEQSPDTRAIAYMSDYYAVGGAAYLYDSGRVVGRDVLLAGYNNIEAVRYHPFPISSAEHPVQRIVEILVREALSDRPFELAIENIVHIRK